MDMQRSGSDDSANSATSRASQTSNRSYHGSAMGIILNQSRRLPRRSEDGKDSQTPLITATPATPTPSESLNLHRQQDRHKSHQQHYSSMSRPSRIENLKRNSQPQTDDLPPYPITPPGSETNISSSSDYISQHPPQTRQRQRAATVPSVPLYQSESPIVPSRPISSVRQVQATPRVKENLYQSLSTFSTTILIDDSPSMAPHWSATQAAFENLATTALGYITDGVEVAFLNDFLAGGEVLRVFTKEDVRSCFRGRVLMGVTPIGDVVDRVLGAYVERYRQDKRMRLREERERKGEEEVKGSPRIVPRNKGLKPLNILILTDGIPTDDVESVIVSQARMLDSLNAPLNQVGIQFVQIGNEEGVREELKDLDDYIANVYGIRDMVDTTRYAGDNEDGNDGQDWLLKALLGGVNRRVDKMG
ncbi:hypothetical protein BZA77DRAFT_164542 [Pyronema omphalodes]|nr:hypothetical protein BZA77DRAFT_164542 [Pyronema omphalodes]